MIAQVITNIINQFVYTLIGGNHANGTRMFSCIVSSIIIYLYVFQIIVNLYMELVTMTNT